MYYIGIQSAVIINDSMEFQLLPLSKGDTSIRDFAPPSGEEPSLAIAGSDGAARVRCSGCSIVSDSGGVLSVQLLQSAFVLCLSCCLDLFNMQLLLYTPAPAPLRCQARVVEQHLRVLHLSPECYQHLSLCASGWARSWV